MALTNRHLQDVCFIFGGTNQCRYLDEDTDDKGQIIHVCKKMSPSRKIVDEEVDEFFATMRKSGQDPTQQGVPLGDNCKGFIVLKTKPQGYDV